MSCSISSWPAAEHDYSSDHFNIGKMYSNSKLVKGKDTPY